MLTIKRIRSFWVVFVLVILATGTTWAASTKNIKIWVNAFIPSTLPGTTHPTPTFKILAGPYKDKTALEGPGPLASYFLTDQRSFGSNIDASSRLHHEVMIDLVNNKIVSVLQKCYPTIKVDSLEAGNELCNMSADATNLKIEDVSISADKLLFSFKYKGAGKNPCVLVSPDIDWDIKVQAELELGGEGGRIKVAGLVDAFPAFEMYASIDGGSPVTLFNVLPEEGKTPWNLIGDPNVRLEPQAGSFIVKEFGSLKNGTWQSNDAAQRFKLKIVDNNVSWTEKNSGGTFLTREATLNTTGTNWKIERPNDSEVLKHLGFQQNIIPDILALGPRSSYILFNMKDGKLTANWYGLIVIKKPDGSVKELVQPGVRPPTQFIFLRQ